LRIGMLVTTLYTANPQRPSCHGVGFYVQELLAAMLKADPESRFILIGEKPLSLPEQLHSNPNVKEAIIPFDIRGSTKMGFWREWVMAREQVDILHEPEPCAGIVRLSRYPLVLTVHDIIPLLFPQWFRQTHRGAFAVFTPRNIGRADAVIALSESTRRDLERVLPWSAGKGTVIHEAGQSLDLPEPPEAEVAALGINKPYLLTVSTIEPRKNHTALLEAYDTIRQHGLDLQLVLAGQASWQSESILKHPSLSRYSGDVLFLGTISPEMLAYLYRNAELFIYPSLYEGFGMPPLEALTAGIPVIVGRNSSFPEVLGTAPYYLSERPTGPEIAQAVESLMGNPGLRSRLSTLGKQRAREFSWEKTASQTLQVYEDVLRRRRC